MHACLIFVYKRNGRRGELAGIVREKKNAAGKLFVNFLVKIAIIMVLSRRDECAPLQIVRALCELSAALVAQSFSLPSNHIGQ